MAITIRSLSTHASSSCARPRAAAAAVPRVSRPLAVVALPPPGRGSSRVFSSDTGAENDDKLVGERGEILQGKQEKKTMVDGGAGAGMEAESARAEAPAQGGAPEGDRVKAGEETQLTGEPSGDEPEAGDKLPDSSKDASQTVAEEAGQQEARQPLQGDQAKWGEGSSVRSIE